MMNEIKINLLDPDIEDAVQARIGTLKVLFSERDRANNPKVKQVFLDATSALMEKAAARHFARKSEKSELGEIFEHDCGQGAVSWRIRIANDFGEEAVEPFGQLVKLTEGALERAEQSIDPETNTDLLFYQLLPEIYPDPMKSVKQHRGKKGIG